MLIYIRMHIHHDQTVSKGGLWKATCLAWVQPVEQTAITTWNSLSSTSCPISQAIESWREEEVAMQANFIAMTTWSSKNGVLDSHKARQ